MKRIKLKTYLAMINNSVRSELFKNFYVEEDGKEYDAMREGRLSCAFYVSGILKMFDLAGGIHGTVEGTTKDLEENGWWKIEKPEIGSVLVWEGKTYDDGEIHKHIGFYVGDDEAISNSTEKGCPVKHNWQFDGARKVESIYWREIV